MPDNFVVWMRFLPESDLFEDWDAEGLLIVFQVSSLETILYSRCDGRNIAGVALVLQYRLTLRFTWHSVYGALLDWTRELQVRFLAPTVPALPNEAFNVRSFDV